MKPVRRRAVPSVRVALAVLLVFGLTACPSVPTGTTQPPPPNKGFPTGEVRGSVYLPLERSAAAPPSYALYTVLLTRSANVNTLKLLAELFKTADIAGKAALARENLNLIIIPVTSAPHAERVLEGARSQPEAAAGSLMQKSYDFGQAALLIANLCRADRGAEVMRVCGPGAPAGPLLVTALRPLDGNADPTKGERLLIVNLSTTPPEAIAQLMETFSTQVMSRNFDSRDELDGWRLKALDYVIRAARLLPSIRTATAATFTGAR